MNVQAFVAQFWGWLTLTVALILFVRPKVLHDVKRLIVENRAFGLAYGLMSLILGITSVLLHNVWELNWHVVITIFGWLAVIGGTARMLFPETVVGISARMLKEKTWLTVAGAAEGLLGLWLCYVGYLA